MTGFSTDWDIEKYKTEFESEDHWKLRQDFLLAHKNKYPEERLVCLAQVFYNVEFLGCKYPEKTMKLVENLSKEIAAEYREQQKMKLQRTFVGASDAAGAKVKGRK
ncbi:partner of xrn-2 protein 1-like [Lycorma delicatula]|uniref:partner of xrn-2 protein 1-like n=1 Tax=Lycorma delicatula TaxID=130591 RepID=UPI003F50D7C6